MPRASLPSVQSRPAAAANAIYSKGNAPKKSKLEPKSPYVELPDRAFVYLPDIRVLPGKTVEGYLETSVSVHACGIGWVRGRLKKFYEAF